MNSKRGSAVESLIQGESSWSPWVRKLAAPEADSARRYGVAPPSDPTAAPGLAFWRACRRRPNSSGRTRR